MLFAVSNRHNGRIISAAAQVVNIWPVTHGARPGYTGCGPVRLSIDGGETGMVTSLIVVAGIGFTLLVINAVFLGIIYFAQRKVSAVAGWPTVTGLSLIHI